MKKIKPQTEYHAIFTFNQLDGIIWAVADYAADPKDSGEHKKMVSVIEKCLKQAWIKGFRMGQSK